MKTLALTAATLVLTTAAHAQPSHNWTGGYLGGHAGIIVDGGVDYTYTDAGNFEPADRPRPTDLTDEAVFGFHAGYLHQFGQFVAGLEASATLSNADGVLAENPPPKGNDYQTKTQAGNLYAITGRLGFAIDRLMIYGKGGYAWTDVDFDASFFNKDGPEGENGTKVAIGNTFDFDGPVIGAGFEYAITQNITLGVEYLHYDFDTSGVATLDTTNSGITSERVKADYDLDTVTARLNFKFN